jgi:hypothetical protein
LEWRDHNAASREFGEAYPQSCISIASEWDRDRIEQSPADSRESQILPMREKNLHPASGQLLTIGPGKLCGLNLLKCLRRDT